MDTRALFGGRDIHTTGKLLFAKWEKYSAKDVQNSAEPLKVNTRQIAHNRVSVGKVADEG
jgi:hypothetical protein